MGQLPLLSELLFPPLQNGGGESHPRYGVIVRTAGQQTAQLSDGCLVDAPPVQPLLWLDVASIEGEMALGILGPAHEKGEESGVGALGSSGES